MVLSFCVALLAGAERVQKPDPIKDEWYVLRQAEAAYNSGSYGSAVLYADLAREYRQNRVAWEVQTLKNSFRPAEVRQAGDDIADVIPVLRRREDYDALEIVERYRRNPRTASEALFTEQLVAYVQRITAFPEADFLLGNVYLIEGEYERAEQYYQAAWTARALLDVPDAQYTILYRLADLSHMKNDATAYEEYLTAIVRDDDFFKDPSLKRSVLRIMQNRRGGAVDTLFNVFRPEHFLLLRAYRELSDVYAAAGDTDRALYLCTLAALTGFTRMYAIVVQRMPEYTYDGLAAFLERAGEYADIVQWADDNGMRHVFGRLVLLTRASAGYETFSAELQTILTAARQ